MDARPIGRQLASVARPSYVRTTVTDPRFTGAVIAWPLARALLEALARGTRAARGWWRWLRCPRWLSRSWRSPVALRRAREYQLAWLLAMAGNLGTVIARDVGSFYACFALMSFAAWPLVVHDRSREALAAGRLYLVMTIVGEVLIRTGLLATLPLGLVAARSPGSCVSRLAYLLSAANAPIRDSSPLDMHPAVGERARGLRRGGRPHAPRPRRADGPPARDAAHRQR